MDGRQTAEVDLLRGQIALDQRRGGDADRLLLSAARRMQTVSADLARAAYLDALVAAIWAHDMGAAPRCERSAEAARTAPPVPLPPRVLDVLLDAVAMRATDGYAAAAPALTRALDLALTLDVGRDESSAGTGWPAAGSARSSPWRSGISSPGTPWPPPRSSSPASTGALMHLTFALNYLARSHILAGNLRTAERLIEEDHLIAEATGNPPIADTAMMLAAWRGQDQEASDLIEATSREATRSGADRLVSLAAYASVVLHNGFGRSAEAYAGRAAGVRPRTDGIWVSHRARACRVCGQDRQHAGPHGRSWSGCPNAPASRRPSGCRASKPGSAPSWARARRPNSATVSRSSG